MTGLPNPSRDTKFSGANADREIFVFPAQLTTSRIGNLTRLIHTISYMCDTTLHTYTHTQGGDISSAKPRVVPSTILSSVSHESTVPIALVGVWKKQDT